MSEIENRAGVEELATLHAERRKIIEQLAPLELLFGSGGDRWESARKRHRHGIAKLIEQEQGSMAENKLERLANADKRHTDYCDEIEGQFVAWMKWKTKLSEIEERIESRLAEMRYQASEMRLSA